MPKGYFERSEDHRRHISEALKGITRSDETKAKISQAKKGQMSPEMREQKRQQLTANPLRRGAVLSDETKALLSSVKKGRSPLLRRYGIDIDEYARQIAAGNKWCISNKHFVAAEKFTLTRVNICCDCKSEHYRRYDLKRKFGVTPEWFDAKLSEQGNVCGICGRTPGSDEKNMAVDHNHETGAVRGVLCTPCNTLIERLDRTPDWMHRACSYLARYV